MKQLLKFVSIMFLLFPISNIQAQSLFPKQDSLGMWGYVDSVGNWAYEPVYYIAYPFSGDSADAKTYNPLNDTIIYYKLTTHKVYKLAEKSREDVLFEYEEVEKKYAEIKQLYEEKKEEYIPLFIKAKQDTSQNNLLLKELESKQVEFLQISKEYKKNDILYFQILKEYEQLQLVVSKNVKTSSTYTNPIFSEGLAAKEALNNRYIKFGYINEGNEWEIEAIYQKVLPFQQGFACVKIKGKWGYIDKNGTQVIPAQYLYAESFNKEGKARVSLDNKKFFYISKPQ